VLSFGDRPRGIDEANVAKGLGKLPSSSPVVGSTSPASRPRSFANAAARSNTLRARSTWSASASACASQKVQSRKVPSSPARPSTPSSVR
jgi:hypothetical protein